MKHVKTFESFIYESEVNETLHEANEHANADGYAVMLTGGSIGEGRPKDAKGFAGQDVPAAEDVMSFEQAEEKLKRMNKMLSPGEKQYYKLKYVLVPVKNKKFIK